MEFSIASMLRRLRRDFAIARGREQALHLYTLSIIFLISVGIRLAFLFQPIKYDEAWTFVDYASKPLAVGLSQNYFTNNHLFHTFLVHLAYLVFGSEPWALRLPALFAGLLIVPASYLVARVFFNKDAALLAAGFVATNSVLVEYSTTARGYSLQCLFFLVALALCPYLKETKNLGFWLMFSVVSALGFYTLPTMFYPFGIVILWIFLSILLEGKNERRSPLLYALFGAVLFTTLLTIGLYLPVIMVSGLDSIISNRVVVSLAWEPFVARIGPFLHSLWGHWNRDVSGPITAMFLLGFVFALISYKKISSFRVSLVLPTILWMIPVFLVQRVIPPLRVWIFLLPLYIASAAGGLTYALFRIPYCRKYRPVAVSILSLVISVWLGANLLQSRSVYYSKDWGRLRDGTQITRFLKTYLKPADKVLSVGVAGKVMNYYFTHHGLRLEHLSLETDFPERVVIIVNEPVKRIDPVSAFLAEENRKKFEEFPFPAYSMPKLIRRYEFASVFEMKKKE